MRQYSIFFIVIFITACSQHRDLPKSCENTFVLSDFHDHTVLLEHGNGEEMGLKVFYEGEFGDYSYYDCNHSSLVALQDTNKGYIVTYNLTNGTKIKKAIAGKGEGYNVLIARYKNGFIYSSSLFKRGAITKDLGYVTPNNKVTENFYNKFSENKDSNNSEYIYIDNYLVDPFKEKVIDHYPVGMMVDGEIVGEKLYVETMSVFAIVDLKSKKSEPLFPKETIKYPIPSNAPRIFINGRYYFATTVNSWNHQDDSKSTSRDSIKKDLIGYKKSSLYVLEKGSSPQFVADLPHDDITYLIGSGTKDLHLFTKSRKAIHVDLNTKTVLSVNEIPVDIDYKYELGTVGYTKKYFIVSFTYPSYADTYIVICDKKFQKCGEPKQFNVTTPDITSQQTVISNSDRVNHILSD